VNITKIKNFNEIEESIISLRDIGLVADRSSMKIDNITGSIDLKKEIHIENLINSIRTSKDRNFKSIKITFNNEKFPGVFLKQVRVGTIIIFYSGKVVLVGCKTREDLECLASLTHVLTKII
jgi:TATA-box binding protein (TBP) (component of TFIID and TFIIIB)